MTTFALEPLLSHIAQTLQQLAQTLEEEFVALGQDNFEQIQQTAQNKIELFQKLEKLELQRQQYLNDAGVGFDSDGVLSYLNSQSTANSTNAKHDWHKIETLTQHCRQHNTKNGLLIEKNRRRIEKALSILKGQTPDNQATYTANGTTSSSAPSHTFAKA